MDSVANTYPFDTDPNLDLDRTLLRMQAKTIRNRSRIQAKRIQYQEHPHNLIKLVYKDYSFQCFELDPDPEKLYESRSATLVVGPI